MLIQNHQIEVFLEKYRQSIIKQKQRPLPENWDIDYTSKESRLKMNLLRNIGKEKQIESEISKILRKRFSFGFIVLEDQKKRIGKDGLECRLMVLLPTIICVKPQQIVRLLM